MKQRKITNEIGVIKTLSFLLMVPGSLTGSDIAVQSSKVMDGTSAATLTLSSTCSDPPQLEVTGEVSGGTFTACSAIFTDAQLNGTVVLEAGNTIAFQPGFSVAATASLTANLTPAQYQDAVITDTSPQRDTVYAVRFWANTDDYAGNVSTRFDHFLAYDAGGEPEFRVIIGQGTGAMLFVEVFDDDGAAAETPPLALPIGGWHSIKVVWARSSGADGGSIEICVDEVSCASLGDLDNDTGSIDRVEWGARNLLGGDAGALHLDKFESFRNTSLQEQP